MVDATYTDQLNHDDGYVPGVCNIGKKEIEQRKKPAVITFWLFVLCIVVFVIIGLHGFWKLLLFFPAMAFGISFLQWYLKFCLSFGLKGMYNFGDVGKTSIVGLKENARKDRMKVWKMIITGISFGITVAGVYYFLPV